MMKLASFIVLICMKIYTIKGFQLIIKTIEQCDPNENYDIIMNIISNREAGRQFLTGNVTFKAPLTDDIALNVVVKLKVNNKFRKIINFGEKRGCTGMHKYLGEFLYDLERGCGLAPGNCPIPKGTYRLRHHEINTNKITLQSFPLGNLQFISTYVKQGGQIIGCTLIEVDNI